MATLKISDLSVGDWVKYNDEDYGWQTSKIAACGYWGVSIYNTDTDDDELYDCDTHQIHPIPITAEILEKNGWVFHKGSLWWVCDIDKDTRANVWLGENGECRVEVSTMYGEARTWSNYADVKLANAHIHLLQRVLRLAGVDKEINL